MKDIRNILEQLKSGKISIVEAENKIYDNFGFYEPKFHIGDNVNINDEGNEIVINNTIITDVNFSQKYEEWIYDIKDDEYYFFEDDITKI